MPGAMAFTALSYRAYSLASGRVTFTTAPSFIRSSRTSG